MKVLNLLYSLLPFHNYYVKKVKKIRTEISNNIYPPTFGCKKWRKRNRNCYAYSLDINISDPRKKIFIPGCISDEKVETEIYSTTELISRLKADLDFLGISYRENTHEIYKGEWRIAIYFMPEPHDLPIDFHISRQDFDGIWSEKPSWKAKVAQTENKSDFPLDLSKYGLRLESVLILSKT